MAGSSIITPPWPLMYCFSIGTSSLPVRVGHRGAVEVGADPVVEHHRQVAAPQAVDVTVARGDEDRVAEQRRRGLDRQVRAVGVPVARGVGRRAEQQRAVGGDRPAIRGPRPAKAACGTGRARRTSRARPRCSRARPGRTRCRRSPACSSACAAPAGATPLCPSQTRRPGTRRCADRPSPGPARAASRPGRGTCRRRSSGAGWRSRWDCS